jgi:hypothetical protein
VSPAHSITPPPVSATLNKSCGWIHITDSSKDIRLTVFLFRQFCLFVPERGFFHCLHAEYFSTLKSKRGNLLDKAVALRINLNLDGVSIASKSHTHHPHSQTSRLLTSSLSLGVPVPRATYCMRIMALLIRSVFEVLKMRVIRKVTIWKIVSRTLGGWVCILLGDKRCHLAQGEGEGGS